MFSLRIRLARADGDGEEQVWVGALTRESGWVKGVLLNPPHRLDPRLSAGSEVAFQEDQISDWSIATARGLLGAFTLRAQVATLPPEAAAKEAAILAIDPVPPEWTAE